MKLFEINGSYTATDVIRIGYKEIDDPTYTYITPDLTGEDFPFYVTLDDENYIFEISRQCDEPGVFSVVKEYKPSPIKCDNESYCASPTNLQVTSGDFVDGVYSTTISWDSPGTAINTILKINGITYTVEGDSFIFNATPATEYIIEISSNCGDGVSFLSSETYISSATPCDPPTITFTNITTTTFDVNVTPLGMGDTFDISLDGGTTYIPANSGKTSSPATVSGLSANTEYVVLVRYNCSSTGTSILSSTETIITNSCAPATITGGNIIFVEEDQIATLSWTRNPSATAQVIQYRIDEPTSSWVNVTVSPTASSWTYTSSIPSWTFGINTVYLFRIKTTCPGGTESYTTVRSMAAVNCRIPTLTATSNSINYSFISYASSPHVTSVAVQLLNTSGLIVLATNTHAPSVTSGSFTGLSELTNYRVRLRITLRSGLVITLCTHASINTLAGTIYARLEYTGTPVGSCSGGGVTSVLRNSTAQWRTYSNAAGTVPIAAPAGCRIRYDVTRRRYSCSCPSSISTFPNDVDTYELNLTTGALFTNIPDSHKWTSGLDWFICTFPGTGPCTGTGVICSSNGMFTDTHIVDDLESYSIGTRYVEIIY